MKRGSCLILALGIAAGGLSAETILPIGATSNCEFAPGWARRTITPDGAVNSGLRNLNAETVDTRQHSGSGWASKPSAFVGGYIQYDLGGQYNLSALKIYNGALAGQYNRGVQQIDIQVSNDTTNWVGALTDRKINQSTGEGVEWQTVEFTAKNCRYVRLVVDSNYGSAYAEIAKVQFEGTGAANQKIIAPTSATTTMGAVSGFELKNTYNRVGIRTPSDLMNSTADDAGTYNWVSTPGTKTGEIVYQFDQPQNLQSMLVWNGNDGVNAFRAVNQYDLMVSPDAEGENWTPVITDGKLTLTTNSNIWLGPEAVGIRKAGVRRVKLVIDSNHGDAKYAMLNEVAFVTVP